MESKTFNGPAERFRADVTVPGDKSLSHRALILAAIAEGQSRVAGSAPGEDVASTVSALTALGVEFVGDQVVSPGVDNWAEPTHPLDCGNAGTAMRLLAGALAGSPFRVRLTGDESLSRRPMRRLVAPLGALGARIEVGPEGRPPVTTGGAQLRGSRVHVSVPSAQVRTAVELAALQAEGSTTIDSDPGFRDHTERWLSTMGLGRWITRTRFEVLPGPVPPFSCRIPGDPSSAAVLWASAAISAGSVVITRQVSLNPGRTGFLDVLESMGARVERTVTHLVYGDPVGDVTVVGAPLRAAHVGGDLVVRTIDELPLVALCGTVAEGETRVTGAAELRVKETDRIVSTVGLLQALGADIRPMEDGFVVGGRDGLAGGSVDSEGDHRLAMCAAAAATIAAGPVEVRNFDAAAMSWPDVAAALEAVWSSR